MNAPSCNEVELKSPPTDGVSAVKFANDNDSLLLSSSWDTVSIFLFNAFIIVTHKYLPLLINRIFTSTTLDLIN